MSEKLAPAFIVFLTFSLVIAQVKYYHMISIISAIYYRFAESVSNGKSAFLRVTAEDSNLTSPQIRSVLSNYTKLRILSSDQLNSSENVLQFYYTEISN